MMAAPAAGTAMLHRSLFRQLVCRADWLLVMAIAPGILFPDARQAWALLVIPLVLIAQWLAWGEVLPLTPLNPAILLLAIMVGVSTFVTPDLPGSLGKITGLLFGMVVYFCVVRHTQTKKGWLGSQVLFILAGMGMAVLGLTGTNWATTKSFGLDSLIALLPARLVGLPGAESGIHPNELAGALVWVLPVIFMTGLTLVRNPGWFSNTTKKFILRFGQFSGWLVFLLVSLLLVVLTLVLSQSRGSYLAIGLTALVLIVMIPRWPKRWWMISILAIFGIGGVLLVKELGQAKVLNLFSNNIPANTSALSLLSMSQRTEIWSHAVWAIQDVPLTGLGMNVFRSAAYTLYPTFLSQANYEMGHAHNELLQAALDLGLPGLVGFLGLYIGALGMVFRTMRSGVAWRLLALGILGGLLAHFIFGLIDAVALGAKPGFLFWWLLGMAFGLFAQSRQGQVAAG